MVSIASIFVKFNSIILLFKQDVATEDELEQI